MTKDPNDFKPKPSKKELLKKYPPERYVWKHDELQYSPKGRPVKIPKPTRKKGDYQKDIKKIREAIAQFCVDNSGRIQELIDEVALEDPAKAVDIYIKLLEFHVPKLARIDGKVEHNANIQFHVNTGIPLPPNTETKQIEEKPIDVKAEEIE